MQIRCEIANRQTRKIDHILRLSKILLRDPDHWSHDLENINMSSSKYNKYNKYLCKFWSKSIQWFTSCGDHKISMIVTAWPWPLTPLPWKFNQFFPGLGPTSVCSLVKIALELWPVGHKQANIQCDNATVHCTQQTNETDQPSSRNKQTNRKTAR